MLLIYLRNDNQLKVSELKMSDKTPPSTETYNGYEHCFITVKDEHRFLMLYTFLKQNVDAKIIIFFSTTKCTQYYARLLQRLKFKAQAIHNGQAKEKFLGEFFKFSNQESGCILCVPDFQGNDLAIPPSCSWIIQFEPCSDPSEYIFRIGRISSENSRSVCRALLFLTPQQFGFLRYFKAAKVKFYEYEIPKIARVQRELIKLIRNDAKLRSLGVEAFHAYLLAYTSHDYRDIYNVHELDQKKVALCFGFDKPPSRGEDGADKGATFQESLRTPREELRWKPVKSEKQTWKPTKNYWRYSNVHADKMKVQSSSGKTNPDDYKPSCVKMR